MLRLDKVIKPWKDAAALNDHINLYGFWNETAFLTKSGDAGMVLRVAGVDYESLDHGEQEYTVKRLESALKAFGPGFHVYQYLFKQNRAEIPFAHYQDTVVEAAIDQRRQFFEAKRDRLYQIEIFYCIVLEGPRSKTGIGAAMARLFSDPAGAMDELKVQFTGSRVKTLLRTQIQNSVAMLEQRVQAFKRQLGDFIEIDILNQQGQFSFLRRLVNYDDWRITGKPQSTQFLDYQVVNSTIEAERDHLRVGDHFVRVLTMKEAITETRPLVFDSLLKIVGNFYVVTEWTPMTVEAARKEVNKRRRHFNVSKTGFISQMGNEAAQTTRQTPMEIAGERERFQEMLDLHQQFSDDAQQKMLGYVHKLESRIARLPEKIEAGLDAQKIARLLSESLRQNFLESGLPAAARCLQGTSEMMTRAQKELSAALGNLSDANGGVVAQVESANNRLTQSLEKRENALDALLHQLNTWLLCFWVPLISIATLVIGLVAGMRIEGCMDSVPEAAAKPVPIVVQAVPTPKQQEISGPVGSPKQQRHIQPKADSSPEHER